MGMEWDSIYSQTRSSKELPLVQFRGTLTPMGQNLVWTGQGWGRLSWECQCG